ncbi:hypothetical protein N8I84_17940 [Streptomyces cynarae]|uniref:Uncharacterized protein n=1 Tax=Streptomyces cynarae TaxID=2981134 RepID=A0ABY6E155_9ACTN|nr:hypothetical protein [Streptomyces cynarae]UXY20390.1 hypothetical protein N8I84_17940 [Streptomyces cynarae]
MSFLRACGLVERAGGRSVHRPTAAADRVARAREESEEKGLQTLRDTWRGSWFAQGTRSRLAQGPALRIGLVSKLLTLARAGETHHRHMEVLVDLMVAVGMLIPEDDGYLSWYEHRAVPRSRTTARTAHADRSPSPDLGVHADCPDEDSALEGFLPAPRSESGHSLDQNPHRDLMGLLSPPILLADLARLSAEDVVALHRHICGLAAILAKLRRVSMP